MMGVVSRRDPEAERKQNPGAENARRERRRLSNRHLPSNSPNQYRQAVVSDLLLRPRPMMRCEREPARQIARPFAGSSFRPEITLTIDHVAESVACKEERIEPSRSGDELLMRSTKARTNGPGSRQMHRALDLRCPAAGCDLSRSLERLGEPFLYRLEGLGRDLLRQRAEFLGLGGNRLELLARMHR
jgi:hypothetical protein